MRNRQVIEKEYADYNLHIREVLLDIRDILLNVIPEVKVEPAKAVTPAVEAVNGFKCKTCDRSFKTKGGLKIHNKKSHKK